ncbi:MAG: MarR family transcriptional regulator [Bacteroidia bacterium]|nr:MarR family transcriptional regulator [Bacteroidia bacterium]
MSEQYYKAMINIIVSGHWVTDQVSNRLKQKKSTEPQYNVLRILAGAKGKPMAVQDIGRRMVQRSSNVTRIIDKLVASGYVERKECEQNRRKMDILITSSGKKYLKSLDVLVQDFHADFVKNLSEDEAEKLNRLINKLFNNEHIKNR